jgi:hypothetical protein
VIRSVVGAGPAIERRSVICREATQLGNQREIIQTEPQRRRGVVLQVRPEASTAARELVEPAEGKFYSYIVPPGQSDRVHNMDGPVGENETLAPADVPRVVIQSGGKMWCGYDNFVEHVRALSPLVQDAVFYVGDEEDYIDEFLIRSGALNYRRVHQGYWWDVEDYLATVRPADSGR